MEGLRSLTEEPLSIGIPGTRNPGDKESRGQTGRNPYQNNYSYKG